MNGEDVEQPEQDLRRYLDQFVRELAVGSEEFAYTFDELKNAGCEPHELAWLLSALTNAVHKHRVSGKHLADIAESLQAAAAALRFLFFSQVSRPLRVVTLETAGQLLDLAKRAEELAPTVSKKRAPERDLVRATLQRYVTTTTRKLFDEAVAAVIHGAESVPIDARFVDPDAKPAPKYTADAHIQWRSRPACKALLDGPAVEVLELWAEMQAELPD